MAIFDAVRLQQFFEESVGGGEFPSTRKPREWIRNAGITGEDLEEIGIELTSIPDQKVTRKAVWNVCLDPAQPVLLGYIWAMAWGGQGARNARLAWRERHAIARVLEQIRAGGLSRAQAYELFRKDVISGLGPSFFTKLLFFFSPLPNAYIMDQWTAKSINYLTNREVVLLGPHTPSRGNTEAHFEAYCSLVEEVRDLWAERGMVLAGEQVEGRLFCKGGRDSEAGPWRRVVRAHYPKKASKSPPIAHDV